MPTWRGTLRTMATLQRRSEREAEKRRRELFKQQKGVEKLEALQRANYEVEVYQNQVNLLLSMHKECSDNWDWQAIKATDRPKKPEWSNASEQASQMRLDQYTPGLFDKILRRENKQREVLANLIEQAKEEDKRKYQEALQQYEIDLSDWGKMQQIAQGILSGDLPAYLAAIQETNPFSDLTEYGSSMEFQTDGAWYVEALLHIRGEEVIPSEVKSLLQSGKLSVKQMPKGQFYELYQDHICSCAIRVARELFALLPIQMVFVQVIGDLLNLQTGHKEQKHLLSVAIPKQSLYDLNFETIDCSASMSNFVHQMTFNKSKGFSAVEPLKPQNFRPQP